MSNNYWVVGAAWGGIDDVLPFFFERGYWYCWDKTTNFDDSSSGKSGNSVESQQECFTKINAPC